MNALTFDQIVNQSSFNTLLAVFGHVARLVIERAGEAGELSDIPVRDQLTGELVGWLRGFRNDIARMESSAGFREALQLSAESRPIAIDESKILLSEAKQN